MRIVISEKVSHPWQKAFFGAASFLWFFAVVYQTAAGNRFLEPLHPSIPWFSLFLFSFLFWKNSSDTILFDGNFVVLKSGLNVVRLAVYEIVFVGFVQSGKEFKGFEMYPEGKFVFSAGASVGVKVKTKKGDTFFIYSKNAKRIHKIISFRLRQR